MKIFETHAHYDDECYDKDRDELISAMLGDEGAVDYIINVGASIRGCHASMELADKYERVYAAIGVHPDDIVNLGKDEMEWLKNCALHNPKVVAVGEIGLDYYYPEPEKSLQVEKFREQLSLAVEVNKPVIIHSRDACSDTLESIKGENAQKVGGIIHCYSYSKEAARDFLNLGFYIGIGGVLTFKNAKKLVEAAQYIPMDRIVLETDCPYMAPEPHRGTRNYSENISFVAEKLACIKGLSREEVIDITNMNARKLFGI